MNASSSAGEIIVARANKVQLILTFQEKLSLAIEGTLVCTNYRVTFVPDKHMLSKVSTSSLGSLLEGCGGGGGVEL